MTTSPLGYPFQTIVYDIAQINTLDERLSTAKGHVRQMQTVLRNVSDNLEGTGQALDKARSSAGEVMSSLAQPVAMLKRLSSIVVQYGNDVETHGGRANLLMADVTEAITALEEARLAASVAEAALNAWTGSDEYAEWTAGSDTEASTSTLLSRDERYRDAATTTQSSVDQAEETLAEAWTAWETQFAAWDDAYARAVASLAGVDEGFNGSSDSGTVSNPADPNLTTLADADTPEEVAKVWDSLSDTERERLTAAYPEFVGNLEGIPYEYRIAANVAVLDEASKTTWGEPTDTEIAKLQFELKERGGMPVSLNLFDKNQGTAAMLYVKGFDFDRARLADPLEGVTNVNVLLAGITSSLSGIGGFGKSAYDLNQALVDDGKVGATIVWFGCDTPDGMHTQPFTDSAVEAAETFTGFMRGLDVAAPSSGVTTVIAHSYGSTTAFLAVGSAADNLGVDRLIALGSAGVTDDALSPDPDAPIDYSGTDIFATRAPTDFLAVGGRAGLHPFDPENLGGAVSFDSDGGYGPNADGTEPTEEHHDGEQLLPTAGHDAHSKESDPQDGYLEKGSESFANIIGIISTGEPVTTTNGYGSENWFAWE